MSRRQAGGPHRSGPPLRLPELLRLSQRGNDDDEDNDDDIDDDRWRLVLVAADRARSSTPTPSPVITRPKWRAARTIMTSLPEPG